MVVEPRRFGEEWSEGRRRAMNPLGFMAMAISVVAPLQFLSSRAFGDANAGASTVALVLAPFWPYVHYVLLGVIAHAVLRLWGSRRPLRGTLGISLFACGGPATMVALAVLPFAILLRRLGTSVTLEGKEILRSPLVLAFFGAGIAAGTAYLISFVAALTGLHRRGWWRTVIALAIAFVATGQIQRLLVYLFPGATVALQHSL